MNIRIVTKPHNDQNRRKQPTINGRPTVSRFRGVTWEARDSKWRARVKVNGVYVFDRYFVSEAEAGAAASAARLRFMTHSVETAA